ncbi:TonB-dependent receptor [Luteimonas suaedae]|uniref:TonB-dependent receptor n=1 Tax=Luteimonas suaedae TaxID=2605430 RepID=UPI0011ED1407|nr:TonB-dependent receptor [Luteimonas suaedae]
MRRQQQVARVHPIRPSALRNALFCAICAAFGTQAAQAQETPAQPPPAGQPSGPVPTPASEDQDATELDAVVVTGIRASIQSSIQNKRDATVVSDALSAKDIGDLPALSIGEAIETITGASTHREKGGATEISIRGLGPFLGSASFNGREATNGSGDRSVNFNQFPSELINTVEIYKTQRADFIEGGIAGTINMETVKPLSFGERRIQLDGRATYPEYDRKLDDGEGIGWRGTASYLDQFEFANGGRLGVSLGVQSLESSNPEEVAATSSTWRACDATVELSGNCDSAINDDLSGNIVPGDPRAGNTPFYLVPNGRTYRQIVEHDERDAVFAALQWQPNDTMEVNFDYQWSDRTFTEDRSELVLSEGRRGIRNAVFDENGAMQSFDGQSAIEANSNYKIRAEEYEGAGLNFQWRPSAAWLFSTDLAYSHTLRTENDWTTRLRADDEDIDGEDVAGIVDARRVNYRYDYRGDMPSVIIDPAFDITRWENFGDVPRMRRDEQQREHTLRAFRFDGAYFPERGFLTAVKAGVRHARSDYRDYDDRVEIELDRNDNLDLIRDANIGCRVDFPQDDFLDEAGGNTIERWATFDSRCLFRALTGVDDTGRNPDLRNPANNDVGEKTQALYLMGEFASEWFGLPVTGNFGTRWVKTDVRAMGLRSDLDVIRNADGSISLEPTGEFETEVIKASHDVLLPSFNAALELTEDKILRLGVYRAMARPDLSAMGAGRVIDIEDGEFGNVGDAIDSIAATGNPRTRPLLSWNGDISFEWYPNPDSLLAVALYYKQFTGGEIPVLVDETFVIDGETVVVPVEQLDTTDRKSDLFGFEFTGSHRFSYLPAPFDGLGVKASYNYADSNFENHDLRLGDQIDPETGETTPGLVEPANIFGLSKHVASGSLYWTLGPVDLQAIYKYRSEYYQRFVGGPSQNRYIQSGSTVDFRATWRASEQLSFSLEASNLTDEPRISYMPVPGNFHEYHGYGRRYYLGVRYRF